MRACQLTETNVPQKKNFVIRHFIVSAVKFKNAENDACLSAWVCSVLPSVTNLRSSIFFSIVGHCRELNSSRRKRFDTSWFCKLSFDIRLILKKCQNFGKLWVDKLSSTLWIGSALFLTQTILANINDPKKTLSIVYISWFGILTLHRCCR